MRARSSATAGHTHCGAGASASISAKRADALYDALDAPTCGRISRAAHRLALRHAERTRTAADANALDGAVSSPQPCGSTGDDTAPAAWLDAASSVESSAGHDAAKGDNTASRVAGVVLPAELPQAFESAADLLGARARTAPPFLQARAPAAAVPVNAAAADQVAEAAAVSPGPLGSGPAPEDWFDGAVLAYMAAKWESHAAAIDQDVSAISAVQLLLVMCSLLAPCHVQCRAAYFVVPRGVAHAAAPSASTAIHSDVVHPWLKS